MVKDGDILRACLDGLKDPLFLLDEARDCQFVNRAFCDFFRLERDAECTVPVSLFWPDINEIDFVDREFACEMRLARGDVFTVKLGATQLEGGLLIVQILAGISGNDSLRNFHSQRLETLGMLAGGVAHDFNNVLAGILGHTSYLKTILPQAGSHVESLGAIEDGAKKATGIVQQILNFSRLESGEKSMKIDLCELVRRTCSLLRRAISPEFGLETSVAASAVPVLAVESKLAQVIVNLVINARDAIITPSGVIRVGVDPAPDVSHLKDVFQTSDLACSSYAALFVEDNGQGMAPEILTRVFEPYFTTKRDKGTGLGLSTVAAIVKSFGGVIEVVSEVEVGTRVTVYLPVVEREAKQLGPESRESRKLETGDERILIIDDESPVRNVLSISLQHLGYTVDLAASGVEALEKFANGGREFDLVILDMLMPVLSGERVFFKLKQIRPDVKVLLISGFASEESIQNVLTGGGLDFIQKPFTIEELSRRVRVCLDGAAEK